MADVEKQQEGTEEPEKKTEPAENQEKEVVEAPEIPQSPTPDSGKIRIYHEHQESALCARHCLNNLLQGAYYTEIDLADIAHTFDELEKQLIAETSGVDSTEYLQWLQQNENQNVDSSGNFSVQVLQKALETFDLEMIRLRKSELESDHYKPEFEDGFILNHQSHWFALRRIGIIWYNLNSLSGFPDTKAEPTTITDFYLETFLHGLMQEGYSVFVIKGQFPRRGGMGGMNIDANVQYWDPEKIRTYADFQSAHKHLVQRSLGVNNPLQQTLAMSLAQSQGINLNANGEGDAGFQRALQMSMQANEEEELQRALALSMLAQEAQPVADTEKQKEEEVDAAEDSDEMSSETRRAIAMSLRTNSRKRKSECINHESNKRSKKKANDDSKLKDKQEPQSDEEDVVTT